MSIVFACGAECGIAVVGGANTLRRHWGTVTGAPAIETTTIRTGARSFRFASATTEPALRHSVATANVGYFRGYFRVTDATPGADSSIVSLLNAGLSDTVSLRVLTGGTLVLQQFAPAAATSQTYSGTLVADEWYGVEIQFAAATANRPADWRVWRASTGWVDQTQLIESGAAAIDFGRLQLRCGGGVAAAETVYWDDIVVGTSAAVDEDWSDSTPKGGVVTIHRPTADLAHSFLNSGDFKFENTTNFAQSATTVWQHLDAADMTQTAEYISQNVTSSGLTKYCQVSFGPDESTYTTVHGVMPLMVFRSASTTANEMNVRASDDGTNWTNLAGNWGATGLAINLTSNQYSLIAGTFAPPSGGSWDQTKVNGLRMQFGMSDDINPVPFVNGLAFEVGWIVSTGTTVSAGVSAATAASPTASDAIAATSGVAAATAAAHGATALPGARVTADVAATSAAALGANARIVATTSTAATTAAAPTASDAIKATADVAPVTAAGLDATVSVATATTATADVATVAAAANAPSAAIAATSSVAASSAAGVAVTEAVKATSGVAATTAAGQAVTEAVSASLGLASASGAAHGASTAVRATTGTSAALATALNATVSTATATTVQPGVAATIAVAHDADMLPVQAVQAGVAATMAAAWGVSGAVIATAVLSQVSAQAHGATVPALGIASAGVAAATAAAQGPSVSIRTSATRAQVTAQGQQLSSSAILTAGQATALATAWGVDAGIGVRPGQAAVSSTALDMTAAIVATLAEAEAIAAAYDVVAIGRGFEDIPHAHLSEAVRPGSSVRSLGMVASGRSGGPSASVRTLHPSRSSVDDRRPAS